MQRSVLPALILLAAFAPALPAQDLPDAPAPAASEETVTEPEAAQEAAAIAKFMGSLHFQTGPQTLLKGSLTLNLPEGYSFLNAADAKKVLTELWGNPPEVSADALGLIVPPKVELVSDDAWASVVTYEESGYVSDEDAAKTDYDDLMKDMKKNSTEANEVRKKKGYPALDLVGWALPPVYDKDLKVIYWGKELASNRSETHSLNYDVRVLGRKGVLSLNCVASMNQLDDLKSHAPEIAAIAQFKQGLRYADFDPSADKKAAYGIAGLIAGTAIAAKTGLLKGIFVALLAAKKFVILGLLALGGLIKKLVSRNNS